MNKNIKKILALSFMAIFIISTVSVASLGGGRVTKQVDKSSGLTITNTPADNYKDDKRPTFCETGPAKSSKYITEMKIPTACTQPLAITTDATGNVWFTESNTGNMGEFDPTSKTFQEFANQKWQKGEKSMMWGLASAQDGNIWFTDSQHNLVWKFNPTDKSYSRYFFPKSNTTDGSFPQKLLFNGNTAYINDFTGRKIGQFSVNNIGIDLGITNIPSPGNYNFTSQMTTDSSGKIWYTVWIYQNGGQLVSYDPKTGDYTKYDLPSEIQAPNGISTGPDGKIWVMDTASSIYLGFDPDTKQFTKYVTSIPQTAAFGNASGLIKSPISRPYWNHFDDKGRLWFNEQVANSLAVYDPVKQSLVEYLVPSKNPNWSDCGVMQDCGVAQVLDFAISHDKIWFTEWVENNIGVLDSSVALPISVNISDNMLTMTRGENATISLNVIPNEHLTSPITMLASDTDTGPIKTISVTPQSSQVTVDNPSTVKFTVATDKFAIPGTYEILLSARYNDITTSQYVTLVLQ